MLVKKHDKEFVERLLKIGQKHSVFCNLSVEYLLSCDVIRIGQEPGYCNGISGGDYYRYLFNLNNPFFHDAKTVTDEMIYQALNIPIPPKKVPSNPSTLNLQNFEGYYIEIDGVKYCLVKAGQHCKPIVSLKSDQKISFKIT